MNLLTGAYEKGVSLLNTYKHHPALWIVGLLVLSLPVLFLALTRDYLTYTTETDYISTYVPEAQRILNGQLLQIRFHPPVYPLLLSGFLAVFRDVMWSGILISLIASAVALYVNYRLFGRLFSRSHALFSLLAIWLSVPLLKYSAFTASDLFFYLLFATAVYLTALLYERYDNRRHLLGLGLVIGLAFLTRSNGMTLFACLLIPFVSLQSIAPAAILERAKYAAFILGAALVPIAVWYVIAAAYGMPFMPGGTVDNMAMTYYGTGNRISSESLDGVRGRFDSVFDVILYDPVHFLSQYVLDLCKLPIRLARIVPYPLLLLALPGLFLWVRKMDRMVLFYGICILLPQILLLNMKSFEPRYYLFLVPLLIVAVYETISSVLGWIKGDVPRIGYILGAGLLILISATPVISTAYHSLHVQDAEIGSVVSKTGDIDADASFIVSRKAVLAFHAGIEGQGLKHPDSLDDLHAKLAAIETNKDILFFYGESEAWAWPALEALQTPEQAPDWLELVARENERTDWTLYRFLPMGPE